MTCQCVVFASSCLRRACASAKAESESRQPAHFYWQTRTRHTTRLSLARRHEIMDSNVPCSSYDQTTGTCGRERRRALVRETMLRSFSGTGTVKPNPGCSEIQPGYSRINYFATAPGSQAAPAAQTSPARLKAVPARPTRSRGESQTHSGATSFEVFKPSLSS